MRRTLREATWIMIASALLAGATALFHPKAPAWFLVETFGRWDLPVDRLEETLGAELERVVWIDARKDGAYEKGHREGAIPLNPDRWGELVMANQDRLQEALGRPVIVYCDGRGCERSKVVAERLRQLIGLEPVYVLKGNWRKAP